MLSHLTNFSNRPIKDHVYAFHIAKWLFSIGTAFVQSVPDDIGWIAAFMGLDFFSRLLSAYKGKDLDSREALKGFLLKIHALVAVYALHLVQRYAETGVGHLRIFDGLGKLAASYLIAVEILSILENYSNSGGGLPQKLVLAMRLAKRFIPKTMTKEELDRALNAGLIVDVETKTTTTEKVTLTPAAESAKGDGTE